MPDSKQQQTLTSTIDSLADQCVKCGLCLPHCPTYRISENESESPRGRIAIMQALAKDNLKANAKAIKHLENCLSCRNCESVCPANVEYGHLLNQGRYWLNQQKPIKHTFKTKVLSAIVKKPFRIRFIGKSLRFLQLSGLRSFGRYSGLSWLLGLRPLDALLPKVPSQKSFAELSPGQSPSQGDVALFLGCLSRWCDRDIIEASIYVLNVCGYNVHIPKQQGCCGAMAMHQGDQQSAKSLTSTNADIFSSLDIEAILTTASGCGSMLQEASLYFPNENVHQLSTKIHDISHFISQRLKNVEPKALNYTVALHTPCTLKNVMKQSGASSSLLSSIPGMTIIEISETSTCCGSAGSYMLENPVWANKLAEIMIEKIRDKPIDFLATSNIGCALHLQRAINGAKLKIKVVHPMILMAMSLGWHWKNAPK